VFACDPIYANIVVMDHLRTKRKQRSSRFLHGKII